MSSTKSSSVPPSFDDSSKYGSGGSADLKPAKSSASKLDNLLQKAEARALAAATAAASKPPLEGMTKGRTLNP